MSKHEYKAIRSEVGRDVLRALAFFFVGLPLLIIVIAFAVMW